MALTEAELTICNQALALIGQKEMDYTDTTTADTGTAGNPYNKCDLIYAQTRNALQRSFEWNFARARLELVNDWATATSYTSDQYVWADSLLWKCSTAHYSDGWNTDLVMDGSDYVMDGADYVRDDMILFHWDIVSDRPETYWTYRYALPADFSRFVSKWLRHNEYDYALEGKNIVTDETELEINYLKKVTDPDEFDALFTEVLIYDVAIKLTFSLMGGAYQTQALRNALREERKRLISTAKSINSIENIEGVWPSSQWVNARYGDGKV